MVKNELSIDRLQKLQQFPILLIKFTFHKCQLACRNIWDSKVTGSSLSHWFELPGRSASAPIVVFVCLREKEIAHFFIRDHCFWHFRI